MNLEFNCAYCDKPVPTTTTPEVSISDVGRGTGSFKEALIWDADKDGFLDDFSEVCLGVHKLNDVILKAVRHCNNILMDEMIEEGDDRFITLDK